MNNTLTKSEFHGSSDVVQGHRGAVSRYGLGWLGRRLIAVLASGVKRVLNRPPPPLNLELTDRFVQFRSLEEFEFALASRTDFPACRVRDLMTHSPQQLEAAATRIHEAELSLTRVLVRSAKEPALTGELFRELELKLFSTDQGWREIMEGLMRLTPDFDAYRRVALIKYLQYLRARQTIMRSAFVEKTHDDDEACLHATPAMGNAIGNRNHGAEVRTAAYDRPLSEPGAAPRDRGYRLLPKGETVAVDPGNTRHVELLLAGNRMRLYTGRECYLVDDGNNTYPLQPGKNLVGRYIGCDVVLDAACKAISRTHLIVEPLDDGRVLFTDLSSHGTEVAAGALRGG